MNKKISRIITVVIWLAIAAAIVAMAGGFGTATKDPKTLNYSELLALVESSVKGGTGEQGIKAIQIEYRDVYGLYASSTSTGSDLPKKADFYCSIPSEAVFRADVAAIVYEADPEKYESVDSVSSEAFPFQYESKQTQTSIFLELLPYILMVGSVIVMYVLLMRQQGGGKQMMNFGRSHARVQGADKNKVTFQDVAGADEEKQELQEVVEFMKDPGRYTAIGARVPKGVLLVGPPGTGKTLLAKAVAGEAGVPFFSISGSDFVEMFVGVGASRVRDLFATAKRATPAVIFIDEIDAVGRHRGAGMGGGHDEREQTLNQLLVEMDGFAANEGIVVIAATNRPDILDPALLRPGRFDRQITVNYPDIKGREAILKVHARNKPMADGVRLDILAQRTPGFTGAELANVLNEAAILAARRNKKVIDMPELEEAITRVQMGPEKRSRVVTDLDKKLTAYHEAGHAIVALKLKNCDPVHEVSIIPRGSAGGYTMMLPKEDKNYMTKGKLLDTIAMSLGGRAGEELRLDDISTGAYSDLQHASDLARKMVTEYGMSDTLGPIFLGGQTEVFVGMEWGHEKNYSETLAARIDEEISTILKTAHERALAAISEDMDAFDRVAEMLMKYERVDGDVFAAVYQGADAETAIAEAAARKKAEDERLRAEGIAMKRAEEARKAAEAKEADADRPADDAGDDSGAAREGGTDDEPPLAQEQETDPIEADGEDDGEGDEDAETEDRIPVEEFPGGPEA